MDHISLFELNKIVKQTLDKHLEPSYWVVAEISELRTNFKGHCYLELVEKLDEKVIAKTRATIWANTYRNLSVWFEGMTGQPLKSGLKVLCNVVIQYHELYGFSFNIKDIDANFTLGERARKRKEIINQLISDGIYDMNKEHELPIVPQNIAIISSPTAAGFGDFVNQLENNPRDYHFELTLFKATMQGDTAPESIINALLHIYEKVDEFDLVCIIRGGGSQIDLDCFDRYDLTSHIAQFPLPIFTGIGHERDETISDLVAHTALKTPTAVAEFLINSMRTFEENLEMNFSRLYQYTTSKLNVLNQEIVNLAYRVKTSSKEVLKTESSSLNHKTELLSYRTKGLLKSQVNNLNTTEKHLELINPLTILKRGYTITLLNGQRVNKQKIKQGDKLETITENQSVTSIVDKTKNNND